MNKTLKTAIILGASALILFFMYAFFLNPSPSAGDAVTGGLVTVPVAGAADASSADIVSLLAAMQKINLDRSLFASQLYQSLHDFGVTISPEPYGKDDPFADIGATTNTSNADLSAVPVQAPAPSLRRSSGRSALPVGTP